MRSRGRRATPKQGQEPPLAKPLFFWFVLLGVGFWDFGPLTLTVSESLGDPLSPSLSLCLSLSLSLSICLSASVSVTFDCMSYYHSISLYVPLSLSISLSLPLSLSLSLPPSLSLITSCVATLSQPPLQATHVGCWLLLLLLLLQLQRLLNTRRVLRTKGCRAKPYL